MISASSMRRPIAWARPYSGGTGTPRASASARYASHDPERDEQPRDRRALVEAADRVGDAVR